VDKLNEGSAQIERAVFPSAEVVLADERRTGQHRRFAYTRLCSADTPMYPRLQSTKVVLIVPERQWPILAEMSASLEPSERQAAPEGHRRQI
jgi:hypothetical protein